LNVPGLVVDEREVSERESRTVSDNPRVVASHIRGETDFVH